MSNLKRKEAVMRRASKNKLAMIKRKKAMCSPRCTTFRMEPAEIGVVRICRACGDRVHVLPNGYTATTPAPGLNSTKYKKDKARKAKEEIQIVEEI